MRSHLQTKNNISTHQSVSQTDSQSIKVESLTATLFFCFEKAQNQHSLPVLYHTDLQLIYSSFTICSSVRQDGALSVSLLTFVFFWHTGSSSAVTVNCGQWSFLPSSKMNIPFTLFWITLVIFSSIQATSCAQENGTQNITRQYGSSRNVIHNSTLTYVMTSPLDVQINVGEVGSFLIYTS